MNDINDENKYVSPQQLVEALSLSKGDTVLIASDVKKLVWNNTKAGKEFNFDIFIKLLQEKLGKEGNLLFPTYNWDFCGGSTWDYHKTKSKTGSLSQIALKRQDFIRTQHPIYSFSVWGKDASKLYNMNDQNSFVGDTPFAFLDQKENSKMITIDVNLTDCLTYVHYLEELNNVPYRFRKDFTADYIDKEGNKSPRTYSMYVRYLDRTVITDFTGLENDLLRNKKMNIVNLNDIIIRSLCFKDVHEMVDIYLKHKDYRKIVRLD